MEYWHGCDIMPSDCIHIQAVVCKTLCSFVAKLGVIVLEHWVAIINFHNYIYVLNLFIINFFNYFFISLFKCLQE